MRQRTVTGTLHETFMVGYAGCVEHSMNITKITPARTATRGSTRRGMALHAG